MVKYFLNPFATAGDKTVIPDAVQVSGSVSYEQGFGLDYQKDLLTEVSAKPFPRAQFNELMFDITSNIQQYQQHGVPEFITTADNGGTPFPYSKYAIVRYDNTGVGTNFRIYQSIIDGNTSLPTDTTKWFTLRPENAVPIGTIIAYAGTTAPGGYLKCDGTEGTSGNVSRILYAGLFGKIGITWGAGDGSTTFGLPNLIRRTLMGKGGTATSTIGNTVASLGGEESHVQTEAELAPHFHHTWSSTTGVQQENVGTPSRGSPNNTGTSSVTGSGQAFNIIQPSAVVLYCIRY